MKKVIPNLITCANLGIGSVGIYFTILGEEPEAFYFVIAAGLMDFLDGFAARLLKVQSDIGKQLDSLADLVSFGLLPAFFMLQLLTEQSDWYWVAISIAIFSAVRLAKFNIDETQTDHFKGLPTPANAIMLTSIVFLPFELHEYTLISICVLASILLISPIQLLALKFSSVSWKGNEPRWLLIVGVLALLLLFGKTGIPFLIPFYMILSVIAFSVKSKATNF